jgi:hypothetical protein
MNTSTSAPINESQPPWLHVLQEQVQSLEFGIVQIVVHDRRVVQIERTEKFRFDKPAKWASSANEGRSAD